MNLALALCPIDFPRAIIWARWLSHLGDALPPTYLAWHYQVTDRQREDFRRTYPGELIESFYPGPDPEPVYPGGANQIFIFTMRKASGGGGEPIFWLETDVIPLRPGWLAEIRADYDAKGKPYWGPHLHLYSSPHMNGTGIYPVDWEETSNITECPNYYPWDTWARFSFVEAGLSADTRLLQHHFGHGSFNCHRRFVWEEAVAYHPCKDLSILPEIDPEFDHRLKEPSFYRITAFNPNIHKVAPPYFRKTIAGTTYAYIKSRSLQQISQLIRLYRAEEITEEEYEANCKQLVTP
jgi:hypothetical protein